MPLVLINASDFVVERYHCKAPSCKVDFKGKTQGSQLKKVERAKRSFSLCQILYHVLWE